MTTSQEANAHASTSQHGLDASAGADQPMSDGPIRAYAKLEFPGFSYYIQTLEVTIGRRPQAPTHAMPSWNTKKDVDVDLGPLKSISRLHARIFYSVQPEYYRANMRLTPGLPSLPSSNDPSKQDSVPSHTSSSGAQDTTTSAKEEGRFMLEVLGRNGAFVDDVWVSMNGVVPLGRRTKIQIAERVFYFVLPPPPSVSTGEEGLDSEEEVSVASSSELSEPDMEIPEATKTPAPKFVLKPRVKLTKSPMKRSHSETASTASPADGPPESVSDAKRRRANEAQDAGTSTGSKARSKGGKGASKSIKPESNDAVQELGSEDDDTPMAESATSSNGSLSTLAVAANVMGSMPAFQKPDLSNVQLITNALSSESCAKKGHKFTLQEVYEWLQNTYPWFSQNGRKTGRDWQSSIRDTLGTSREFCKIPRRPDEPGKGIFYTLSTSDLAKSQEASKYDSTSAKAADDTSVSLQDTKRVGSANVAMSASTPVVPASLSKPATSSSTTSATPAAPEAKPAMPRIPLVVGIPPNAERQQAAAKGKGTPGSIESLLETPPIAHHQGKLYLSPTVFGHLTSDQLKHIEGLGAQQALQVLQTYLVTHLKEKLKKTATSKGPGPTASSETKATAAVAAAAAATSSVVPPLSTTPSSSTSSASTLGTTPKPPVLSSSALSAYDQRLEAPTVPRIPVTLPSDTASNSMSSQSAPKVTSSSSTAPEARTASPSVPSIPPNTASSSAGPGKAADKSDDPLAALSALAAHPEAAGLIALLKKQQAGGSGTVKLTPGQLELLQLANRLAMQRKKKKATASTSPVPPSPSSQESKPKPSPSS